jgi:hypothetical protein
MLTEAEYATARTIAIEIGQAPERGDMQPAAEGPSPATCNRHCRGAESLGITHS